MKINLVDLVKAFHMSDIFQGYVDVQEGKIISLGRESDEAEMERTLKLEENWARFIPIPNVIDEMRRDMMEKFAARQPRKKREDLIHILKKAGAMTKFYKAIRQGDLSSAWEAFQKAYMKEAARAWCEENQIKYGE